MGQNYLGMGLSLHAGSVGKQVTIEVGAALERQASCPTFNNKGTQHLKLKEPKLMDQPVASSLCTLGKAVGHHCHR
ncbi:unnamed protein product [Urochloa humidicola]